MFQKKYSSFKKKIVLALTVTTMGILAACGQEQDTERRKESVIFEDIPEEYKPGSSTDGGTNASSFSKADEQDVSTENTATDVSKEAANTTKTDSSKTDDMKKMFGENCIAEQTFEVELSEYNGKVYFVPFAPSADNPEFSMQIIQNGEVLTNIRAYVPEGLASKPFTSLDAVSFYDVNYDDYTDIVTIQTYGNTSFATFYYGFPADEREYGKYFVSQERLSDNITNRVANLSISEIRNFLSDGTKNGSFTNYQEAYEAVSNLREQESIEELDYNLIYCDNDDIPEMVVGYDGYYIDLYTYHDGKVYTLMDQWAYGAMGNAGYEYVPKQNSFRNYNNDYAGLILYTTYMAISDQHTLDTVAQYTTYNFDDANENGMPDENESGSIGKYAITYLNGVEVSYEEENPYDLGEYENIELVMSLAEFKNKLSGD